MKKKIVCFALSFAFIFLSACPCGAESKAISFYIKKNGHNAPILSSELQGIGSYDAVYIDKESAENKRKVIYLTFDAGYENGNVERILDTLKEESVPGAFFILGHLVRKNTDLVKRMTEEGHLVCNHTQSHPDLTKCTKEQMRENLEALERVYTEKTGKKLSKYFRFPEGKFDEEKLALAKEMGYKTVFWSLAYADWDNDRQPSEEKAKRILTENIHDGAILLLHPTSATNAAILKDLIREWRSMGYSFGRLTDIV